MSGYGNGGVHFEKMVWVFLFGTKYSSTPFNSQNIAKFRMCCPASGTNQYIQTPNVVMRSGQERVLAL